MSTRTPTRVRLSSGRIQGKIAFQEEKRGYKRGTTEFVSRVVEFSAEFEGHALSAHFAEKDSEGREFSTWAAYRALEEFLFEHFAG